MSPRLKAGLASLALIAALVLAGAASAQTPYRSAHLSGMAGGGPAVATGVDALLLNPANLAVRDAGERGTELTLFPVGARAGGSLLQTGFYNEYLTGGATLSDREVDTILEEWFGKKMRTVGAGVDVLFGGFAHAGASSGFGGAVRIRGSSELGFNRGVPELVLEGTGESRTFPLDFTARSYSAVEFSAGYGWQVGDRLAVGVAPKLVAGLAYAEMDFDSNVSVSDSALTHRFDYGITTGGLGTRASLEVSPFESGYTTSSPGVSGWGLGADLGATYQASPHLRVSASLTDLGAIHWGTDVRTVTPEDSVFSFTGLELDRSRIRNEFGGDAGAYFEHVIDSMASQTYEDVDARTAGFVSALPGALHLGGRWAPAGPGTYLVGGLSVGLARPGGRTRTPSAYLGGQYRLGGERFYLPLRAGVRVGGERALGLSLGTGLRAGAYELGVGATVTPYSDLAGGGYELAVATALVTVHF